MEKARLHNLRGLEQARRYGVRLSQGRVEPIYISADRTMVWLLMKGESREQLEQELSAFPLYPYMKPQFVPLL
jgi:muconolactone delta-isomerase